MAIEETCNCGSEHHPGANYYVSVIREGFKDNARALYGPFSTHAQALLNVRIAQDLAEKCDHHAFWYAYGTVAMPASYIKPGILNHLLPAIEEKN